MTLYQQDQSFQRASSLLTHHLSLHVYTDAERPHAIRSACLVTKYHLLKARRFNRVVESARWDASIIMFLRKGLSADIYRSVWELRLDRVRFWYYVP